MHIIYKYIKTLAGLSMLLFSFISCKKLVTVSQPRNTITTSEIFSNDAQAASAIAGVYSYMINSTGINSMIFSNGGLALYPGLSSDELNSYQGVQEPYGYAFLTNTLNNNNPLVDGLFWGPIYKIIYDVNAIIDGVNASTSLQLTDSARHQLVGESKFIRAFCYFYLTNVFGDVPMPLTEDFNQTVLLGKTPQTAVYKQMEQDLMDAQGLLGSDYSFAGNERIRANKWAATALLARVYLYQGDWKEADSMATAVIGSSQFSLLNDLTQVFLKNSKESILQLQPSSTQTPYGPLDINSFLPPVPWNAAFPPPYDAIYLDPSLFATIAVDVIPNYYLSSSMSQAFESGDKRKSIWTGYTPTPNDPPSYNGDTLLWPNKYTRPSGPTAITQYYTVLRLAEQYLIRAEAKAEEQDFTGAAADINTIRSRAGLSPTTASSKDQLLAAVAQERRVELFAEWGHRWFDLKRTDQASSALDTLSYKQPWNDYQLLYPIPVNELNVDPNLSQNFGY